MANIQCRSDGRPEDCTDHPHLPVNDRQGNGHCFNCLVIAHQSQAYNLASRMLGDRFLAEDAVQESFASAYRSFAQFRGDNLRAWVMRIVANNCRDMLRSRRSRPELPLNPVASEPEAEDSIPSAADLASSRESPEEYAERQELSRTIQAGLASLSAERRLALVVVDVQGFSYEEAANILNCSLGTVKSRISRGRRELRDFLRASGELLPSRFRQAD